MDAQVEHRQSDTNKEEGARDGVEGYIFAETTFLAEVVDLTDGYQNDEGYDEEEGNEATRLSTNVARSEALNRDPIKSVVRQGTDPSGTEPEDCLLDLSGQTSELAADAVSIKDCSSEGGGEETADGERSEGWVVGEVRRIGDETDVEKKKGEGGREKDGWRGGEEGKEDGEC